MQELKGNFESVDFDASERPESNIERENFEKIALFIRHPAVDMEQLLKRGDDNVPWDAVELSGKFKRRGADGADREAYIESRALAEHLIAEIPRYTASMEGSRPYALYSSDMRRARILGRYIKKNLHRAHQENHDFPLPSKDSVIPIPEFRESLKGITKTEYMELVEEGKREGKGVMELWFEKHSGEATSILNQELDQSVRRGLAKIIEEPSAVDIIFSHRLIIALTLWAVDKQRIDGEVSEEDLPEIMEIARRIAYASESEIGLREGKWHVLRRGDVTHLPEKEKKKGTF